MQSDRQLGAAGVTPARLVDSWLAEFMRLISEGLLHRAGLPRQPVGLTGHSAAGGW